MPRRIYSRRIPVFETTAMLILCVVFVLIPFALRGARLAVEEMQNNVADWLPKHFAETRDLAEFRKWFVGDQFVVMSGPWCREGNPSFTRLLRKLFEESVEYESILRNQNELERIRAHHVGDELGLLFTGNYHEDWGQYRERWLQGSGGQWYWINRKGELYRWKGQNNIVEGINRYLERLVHGRNQADGEYVDTFGPAPDDVRGIQNPFYQNPLLLCARPFKSVTSGPQVLEKMAGEGGTMRIGQFGEQEAATLDARIESHRRLTGALFGPAPPDDFRWDFRSLVEVLRRDGEHNLVAKLEAAPIFQEYMENFLAVQVRDHFEGNLDKLRRAPEGTRLETWFRMWFAMGLEPPPRQTCLVITINDPFLQELDRIVGHPIMGKPRGRLLEIATGEVGLAQENVHVGGPPSDNVAIDEEGTKSLMRLASLSGLIGIVLAYYSFRKLGVTMMLFFVGGLSAIMSLSFVWYGGSRLDAILMTMPSLIYVLAISGAVHLVNYYRDACREVGAKRGVDVAVAHGWFPCALAAFTTAIGLASLCTSNLAPIYKFGLFSAIGTMATLLLLYSFLPAALTVWPPGWKRVPHDERESVGGLEETIHRFWERIGNWVIRRHRIIVLCSVALIVFFAFGLAEIKTTVQLLKLFDPNAKILQDYRYMETHLGKLVPMEVVVNLDQVGKREAWLEKQRELHVAERAQQLAGDETDVPPPTRAELVVRNPLEYALTFSLLERMEMSYRVRTQLERVFGPDGLNIVGAGMSSDVFAPLQWVGTQFENDVRRRSFNDELQTKYDAMLAEDYLAVTNAHTKSDIQAAFDLSQDPNYVGREMWRISLRLAALNDVDYGTFVNDLKMVVEPILAAYHYRTEILRALHDRLGNALFDGDQECTVLVLGRNPRRNEPDAQNDAALEATSGTRVDQTILFTQTLSDLLENRGFRRGRAKRVQWVDPSLMEQKDEFFKSDAWIETLKNVDLVVLVENSNYWNETQVRQTAVRMIDARQHRFSLNPRTPFAYQDTAVERKLSGEPLVVTATYTGIVPIVYKAQRALLTSLIQSIMLSFGMISVVMMLLLRDWKQRWTWRNTLNVPAALIVMLPNVFPIVLVFGAMGYWGISVDIGSMMTASVAMGIAVDDTIHFLNWYRHGLQEGHARLAAIRQAYRRCGMAMTQTTLIAGLGLSVFALSTFAPTQRFGVLMLVLLLAALIGDLVLLPAILASPLGKLFGKSDQPKRAAGAASDATAEIDAEPGPGVVSFRVVKAEEVSNEGTASITSPDPNERTRRKRKG